MTPPPNPAAPAQAPLPPWEGIAPPGDDVVPVPPPLDEIPPDDRWCDLVLTGGVASGVVYPWAIVELARAYRFRNIGGTSVGAIAAALAAAAEYGRRCGHPQAFEPLRRTPGALARMMPGGGTRMLSLFQPAPHGRRLLKLWAAIWSGQANDQGITPEAPPKGLLGRAIRKTLRVYWGPGVAGVVAGALFGAGVGHLVGGCWAVVLVGLLNAILGSLIALVLALRRDFVRGVASNLYGLCKGGTLGPPGGPTGLSEWLHQGIQRSAGLKPEDPPLTFADLWCAPLRPGDPHRRCEASDPVAQRGINLQMITSCITLGRPFRLPLEDQTTELYVRLEEWKDYFPPSVLAALEAACEPYQPEKSESEPPADDASARDLLRLPQARLPLVVAARLSLSFPLLFSVVPLWAVDREAPKWHRKFRRVLFSDGGVSSNFPIHLFDASVPRWPTFGFWLDRHPPYRYAPEDPEEAEGGEPEAQDDVWLPRFAGQGRGDNWERFDPASLPTREEAMRANQWAADDKKVMTYWQDAQDRRPSLEGLFGLLGGMLRCATDWRDRSSFRLPHVRNRVARLMLRAGEGGLNIGMSRAQILQMAHRYGTVAGRRFVARFREQDDGTPARAWREQRWIRFNLLLQGLRERLDGLAASAAWAAGSVPLDDAIAEAQRAMPVNIREQDTRIASEEAHDLQQSLDQLEALEQTLRTAEISYRGEPSPELRLRAPL